MKIQVNSQGKVYLTSGNKVLIASGNADNVVATNNTGNTVNSGDKVWINKNGNNYELVNYYSSVPNFNIVGSPTITDKVVSGFSSSNYLKLEKTLNNSYNTFEIKSKFNMTSLNNGCNIILADPINDRDGIVLGISNVSGIGKLWLGLAKNNSWSVYDSIQSVSSFSLNTDYWIKLIFDGSKYIAYSSVDGENWVIEHTCISSTKVTMNLIGIGLLNQDNNYRMLGSIDLKETYIKINNASWWTPYASNLTSESYTGVAGETIANGSSGTVKTVLES